jgi:hypothetical protein
MNRLFLATLFCCLSFFSNAQKEPAKFGEVTMEEMKMNFSSDTSAAAVILFDRGESVMTQGFITFTYRRHVRIKILKKEAFADWINGGMVAERGTVSKLKGATYNLENGKIVTSPMEEGSVFKTRVNKYLDEFKFTLPNVKEGSIIEYSFVIDAETLTPWQFQYSIPSLRSEYTLKVPEQFEYKKYFKGTLRPTEHIEKGTMEKWVFVNVPAFKAEPLMPNAEDYLSQVYFSFSKRTWFTLNDALLHDENFGETITGFQFLRKDVETLLAGVTDSKEKMKILSKHVKSNVEWDGTRTIYAEDLRTVAKNKKGTAADINFLLASMLDKAGVRVEMVLVSTRGNGFLHPEMASTRQFNYVICAAYIDTVRIFLDATDRFLPWDVLPQRCLNGDGFLVSDVEYGFLSVDGTAKARTTVRADLALDDAGRLSGKLTYLHDGYAGQEMRSSLKEKGKELYLEDFKAHKSYTIHKSEFQDIENLEKPAAATHEIDLPDNAVVAGDMIYLNPYVALNVDENPFKPETREFPIDFGTPTEILYLCNIIIPDNYIVDGLPEPKVMMLPNKAGKYFYQVTHIGNKLTVVSNLQIHHRIFMQDQYPNLRELFSRVVAKQSEQIVLKKKN